MRALLVVLLLALLAIPTDAEACSCVSRTFAQHTKDAKQVLLARAGKPVKTGDALKQTFTVLATFKGTATKQFLFDRPATPPCAANYKEGEIAILFTSAGDLDPCHGNWPLGSQVQDLASILDATKTTRVAAKGPEVEAALREALTKYLHDRPAIFVRHPPLSGTSLQIGKSKLTYRKTKVAGANDVDIKTAFATDSLAFVEGTYAREGVRFSVLLNLDTTWTVLWASVAER